MSLNVYVTKNRLALLFILTISQQFATHIGLQRTHMPRSKSSVPPPQHKMENKDNTVKCSKQQSFDVIDAHSLAIIMLRQKAERVEHGHVLKMEKYVNKHAIVMKDYADKILDIQMGLDALCQYHGETYED